VNNQIGIKEFKYGVTYDTYLQVVKGSRDLLLEFWDAFHNSGTVQVENFKFGMNIDHEGH